MEQALKPQHWAVSVSADGTEILTIESNCLSGVENIADYADTVRTCADHLHAFIGPHTPPPEAQGNVAVEPMADLIKRLKIIAAHRCSNDLGFDTEIGPLGCALEAHPGGSCFCAQVIPTVREAASSIASLSERLAEVRAQSDRFCDKYLAALKRAEAAEAKLAEAREIIEPFADWPVLDAYENTNFVDCTFRAGDFRRARAFRDSTSGAKS